MKDLFALLDQPRSPWLDIDTVQQAFVSAAAELHPDRIHDASESARREAHDQYTALNEAHLCLKNSRSRLRHLLELERGGRIKDLQEIPDDLMELFSRLNTQLKAVDEHCTESALASSPLLRVTLFERGEDLRNDLQETQTVLQQRMNDLENRLRSVSGHWELLQAEDTARRDTLLAELETLFRLISFHDRWRDQVQTRMMQLMEQV